MNVHHHCASHPTVGLALRIARRADELARTTTASAFDVQPWLRAEEEILGLKLPQPRLRAAPASHAFARAGAQ